MAKGKGNDNATQSKEEMAVQTQAEKSKNELLQMLSIMPKDRREEKIKEITLVALKSSNESLLKLWEQLRLFDERHFIHVQMTSNQAIIDILEDDSNI